MIAMLVFEFASMMVDYDTLHEQYMVCFLVYRGHAAFSSALVVPHDEVHEQRSLVRTFLLVRKTRL